MANTLAQSGEELKSWLQQLDKTLFDKALEGARKCYGAILGQLDDALADHRSADLRVEHRRRVWYQTCLGPVQVLRRVYRDGKHKRRYLLDEMIGMGRRDHTTTTVKFLALDLAASMPYRRSAEVLRQTSAIDLPHQTVWRLVARAADPYLEKAENQVKWFAETGEIPEGEGRQVARLIVEADGVIVSLQREKERKTEVKLGIAYEGWAKISKDRYRTVNKTVFATTGNGDEFWTGMTLKLHKKYDLSRVRNTIVGGDGAGWVKDGANYVGGRFQLDRYHLNRELTTALGKDRDTKSRVWQAIERGEAEMGLQILSDAQKKARGEQAEKIKHAYSYLQANISGLDDYRLGLGQEGKELRRTGAMEGNVDKLVARRMKNQGMSWSLKGLQRLLCVRFLVLEGRLTNWLRERAVKEVPNLLKKTTRRLLRQACFQNPTAWLQASLPALRGPHASRPWVSVLRSIAEVPTL